jgi:protein arginine kinase activator
MGESLKCSLCGADATVHLTQIVNNKIHKVDLCESCAQKKGVTNADGFSLADLLAKGNFHATAEDSTLKCPDCGFTVADFRRTGRLGCPTCYSTFRKLLLPALEDMHPGLSHCGKIPERSLTSTEMRQQIENLKQSLAAAIESEAYEDAADIRDQIRQLESESLASVAS